MTKVRIEEPLVQDDHAKVFNYIAEETDRETCLCFAPIVEATGLPRARVRFICRHLARRGLLKYSKALWSEDGDPRGSGYGLTAEGWKLYWNKPPANSAAA